ncbi:hypothetical protein MEQU1_002534 [Malassezia equina]|uniref:Meiotically up-regulated gene 190 protein n=1 Tax=Malassezia equina TaxID=1381935 RepID=A0AAF0EFV6_9BASI|nr:hypothetical protein MEQU1_002534 [Malassezia equina]
MTEHHVGEGWSERNQIPTVQQFREEQAQRNPDTQYERTWRDWMPTYADSEENQGSWSSYLQSFGEKDGEKQDGSDLKSQSISDASDAKKEQKSSNSEATPQTNNKGNHQLVSDKGGGEEEKNRIKEAARQYQEGPKNDFVAKGKRVVEDPVTGRDVVIQDAKDLDIDPTTLDSRYRGGFSTKRPPEEGNYESKYATPDPARPTSILLQRFPDPVKPDTLKTLDELFSKIFIGYASVVVLVWGVATVGHGWFAFMTRTLLLGLAALAGFLGLGLIKNKLLLEFERIRASMHRQRGERFSPPYPESVEWLNAAVAALWKQMNPEMFTAALDQVEDIMQSSLPGIISSVKISDFGLGSNPLRFIAMRGLADLMTDEKYPRSSWIEKNEDKQQSDESLEKETKMQDMNLDEQVDSEIKESAMEDLAGDFLNMEVSFCYAAMPGQSSKDRTNNTHLLIEFFIGAFDWVEIPLPVWVQVERIIGTVRLRAQIMSEPPFLRNLTFTLMGVPSVSISAIPMTRMLPNVLDLPIISQFVQSSIAAAANMYVAPRSMTMNMSQILGGDGIKKDTEALGVLVVNIHYGEDLSSQDMNGQSDPYCVLSFAKFGRPMYATRIIFEDLNPVWEETAFLLVSKEDIRSDESLSLQLWDSDKRTADDIVGRVNKPLRDFLRHPNEFRTFKSDLMGFEDADSMQGKLCWSAAFFEKARLNTALRHKKDTSKHSEAEKEAERSPSEKDKEQEALALDTPPDEQWRCGVMSVIIKYVAGLERRDVEKGVSDSDREGAHGQDVEMSSSALPCGYCELILNDNMFYKTRVKQYTNMPYFQAGTEIFVRDWTKSELRIIVRDSRLREHDPIMGIVSLPLKKLLSESSQIEQSFSIQDGVGYGKVATSIVFRQVKADLPRELTGFSTVTLDLLSSIEVKGTTPENTKKLNEVKVTVLANLFSKKLGSLRKQTELDEDEKLLSVPIYDRYSTNLIFSFGRFVVPHLPGPFKAVAVAMLPLRELEDGQITDVELPVLAGSRLHTLERNFINKQTTKTHEFEQIGSLSVRVQVTPGLSEAHRPIATGSRDRHEFEVYERLVGLPTRAEINSHANDDGVITSEERKAINKLQTQQLHMRHRGAMGYTPIRTAVWAKDGLKDHIRTLGSHMLGSKDKKNQFVQSET